jgi:hypothetical protein
MEQRAHPRRHGGPVRARRGAEYAWIQARITIRGEDVEVRRKCRASVRSDGALSRTKPL